MRNVEPIEKSSQFCDVTASDLAQVEGGNVVVVLALLGLAIVASQVYDRYAN